MSQRTKTTQSQAGFTLVELAIVMIIIGLLIGGVLKGQELIGNAQVTATVAQLKAIDAATTTFRDTYANLPGDFPPAAPPNTRLPNCGAAPCNTVGDGNGRLATFPDTAPLAGSEGLAFFPQLAAANLVTGIVPTAGAVTFGQDIPAAKINGNGLRPGSSQSGAVADFSGATGAALDATGGLWLALTSSATADIAGAAQAGLKPTEAFRIDTKIDDGSPNTGIVRAFGAIGAGNCADLATNLGVYNTNAGGNVCGLYVRIQS